MRIFRAIIGFTGAFLALSLAGCGWIEGLFGGKGLEDLASMGINGAKAMYIAPGRDEAGGNKIFKINADGYAEEVTYLDEKGKELTITQSPMAIYDANEKYVMVLFGQDRNNPYNGYLVDKTTEAVYDLGDILPVPCDNYYKNGSVVQSDAANGIFFRYHPVNATSEYRLRKIDVSFPQNVTSADFSRDTDYVDTFSIEMDGNGIYDGSLTSDRSTRVRRIQKANGGIADVDEEAHWTGPDGKLYFLSFDEAANTFQVNKVSFGADCAHTVDPYGLPGSFNFSMLVSFELPLADRMAMVSTSGVVYEVYNPAQMPRAVTLGIPFTQVVSAACSADAYFIAGTAGGQGSLAKVNPVDGSAVNVVDPGTYSFYKMVVDEAGKITFNAIRYSDGVKVIGQIDASGAGPYQVSAVDEATNAEVLVLERIR